MKLYEDLLHPKDIRVLVIEPGEPDVPIYTRLEIVNLRKPSSYEALSYSWDGQIPQINISCNSRKFLVTQNVYNSMRMLRARDRPTALWIDQVCINQEILQERQSQVSLMGEIYSLAEKVVVWLGHADNNTEKAWKLLRRFLSIKVSDDNRSKLRAYGIAEGTVAAELPVATTPDGKSADNLESPMSLPQEMIGLPAVDSAEFLPVIELFSRSWFLRSWTFQEIVIGGPSSIVRCGPFVMEFRDLDRACRALDACGYYDALPWPSSATEALGQVLNISAQHAARQAKDKPPRIDYTLGYTKFLKASDPRDKVYALLGILDHKYAQHIYPNYTQPVSHAFCAAVRASIFADQCLAILSQAEAFGQKPADIPSWSPDWRQFSYDFGVYLGMRPLTGKKRYSASGDSLPQLVPWKDSKKLFLKGIKIKKITRTMSVDEDLALDYPSPSSVPLDSSRWAPSTWRDMYHNKARSIPQSCLRATEATAIHTVSLPTTPYPLESALEDTVTAGIYSRISNSRDLNSNFPAYAGWKETDSPAEVPPQVLREHDNYVCQSMKNRRVFIAGDDDDAYLGMASVEARPGDWIIVFFGGDTPFVLRPQNAISATDTPQMWEFVGPCYIHGMMDGEAGRQVPGLKFYYLRLSFQRTARVTFNQLLLMTATLLPQSGGSERQAPTNTITKKQVNRK
ncbi:Heterokaryon incompatibility protein [Hyphodiscus hymeniophilus]|uniref:Heterokaryon incompatibility protein n=1 Tax=Hyphodiscus hymeniophilus TaxID=353542 RepID=A0A9P6VN60_9HELO|nr:Heterokaryon incompatibility protein [Hyphodiscus hymeniophilus]